MRRPRAGGPLVGVDFHYQQAVRLGAVRQNIMHPTLVAPFPTVLYPDVFRPNEACREAAFARRAAYRQLQIGIGSHLDFILRRDVDRPRRGAFKRRHPFTEIREIGMLRFHRRQPSDQHQAQLAIAALQRHGLPFFQHPDIKADIAPTGALRRNMLDLSLFSRFSQ